MRYLLIILLGMILAGASIEDARKANEAYEEGNYERAITLYKRAIDADPDNAKLYYNLASAQAKAGKSQEAIRTFEQFKNMSDDPERTAMANYDIGNIFAQDQKWDRAVEYYRKSLQHTSDDRDAKHNYELAINKSQNQKEKDKDKKDKKSGQDDKQDDQDQKGKNDKQKNKDDSQQQKGNQDQQNKNQQDKQRQKQQRQQNEVSKAQAQKILRALEQKEKQLLKKFKKKKVKPGDNKNEKDW